MPKLKLFTGLKTLNKMWHKLPCKRSQLQLEGTLNGGQSFRWKKVVENDIEQWIGVYSDKLWILQQSDDDILYRVYDSENTKENVAVVNHKLALKDYFHLDIDIEKYFEQWSHSDPYFKEAAQQFYGIRILKQDLIENIFSFICSSNNNIARISSMVEKLANFYGSKICELNNKEYFTFPIVESLAKPEVEEYLRLNGFGYRAKYISKTAKKIVELGEELWCNKLKDMNYTDARTELMTLPGIGPKVADCICLMSLNHLESVPVDTHVHQIAARYYLPKLAKQKNLTKDSYNEIGKYFRNLYGPLAGWAHTVLFCADLKKFKTETESKSSKRKKKC